MYNTLPFAKSSNEAPQAEYQNNARDPAGAVERKLGIGEDPSDGGCDGGTDVHDAFATRSKVAPNGSTDSRLADHSAG